MKIIAILIPVFLLFGQPDKNVTKKNDGCERYYDSKLKTYVYTNPDQMPEYPGGFDKLLMFYSHNLRYTDEDAQKEDVQGSVKVTFLVDKKGKLFDVGIYKKSQNSYSKLDKETIKVFYQMPKWIPGKCNRKAVIVQMKVPIYF